MVRRGELYRVSKPTKSDPKNFRVFVVVGQARSYRIELFNRDLRSGLYELSGHQNGELKSELTKV